jgi:hypothetical protein
LKVKGSFPFQKPTFYEKNEYIYIRKGGKCLENIPPLLIIKHYTNMGKSKWFCPTAKPRHITSCEKSFSKIP